MSVFELVVAEIEARGPIPFSRFMQLALYHPQHGFYARGGAGRRRDFITSPEVGPLYGAVVARALDDWWDRLGRPGTFEVVDAGAGPGTLARAVLAAKPACLESGQYVAVESSARQRDQHPTGVASVAEMPDQVSHGVIFANELLDNMPFDIAHFEPGAGWFDVLVDTGSGALHEVLVERATEPTGLREPTRPCRVAVQDAACAWLSSALQSVRRGAVVVVDYAVPRFPVPEGHEWLRTYADQARGAPPLGAPGSQDITADIDISALARVCEPDAVSSQADWLRRHGIDELVDEGRAHWHEHKAAPDLAAIAMRSRVTEADALLDADGLGNFTVLEWSVSLD